MGKKDIFKILTYYLTSTRYVSGALIFSRNREPQKLHKWNTVITAYSHFQQQQQQQQTNKQTNLNKNFRDSE